MFKNELTFADVLAPLGADRFFTEYWERAPLHIAREDPSFYGELFTARDVDAVLTMSRPRWPQLRLVQSGKPFPIDTLVDQGWTSPVMPSHMMDAKIAGLYDMFAGGYTVIVELEKLWAPVTAFCRSMEMMLHHKATAEIYMTPLGAQGFDLHYDHHEVFILQLEGEKRWQLFDPVSPLPVDEQLTSRASVGAPRLEATLRPGDLLYIPRGCPHEGATSDKHSLHITFGVYLYRWQNLIAEVLKDVTARDIRFRESVPLGFLRDADPAAVAKKVGELLGALQDGARADTALENLALRFLARLDPVPDGHFDQLNRIPQIDVGTELEKRSGSLCYVRCEADAATVYFPGNRLSGPFWLEPALRYVATTNRFTPADLPGLIDDESRLLLARRLVKEGMLRIASPRGASANGEAQARDVVDVRGIERVQTVGGEAPDR